MKLASVYLRKARLFVHASSQTTDGVWIFSEPCIELDAAADDHELGVAIRTALDASRTGVPHPRTWGGLLIPLLQKAGVKSWQTFAKGAASVEVEDDGQSVSVIPCNNLGPEEGFEPDSSGAVTVDRTDVAALGSRTRQLLLSSSGSKANSK